MKTLPVYVIDGLLESGKTTFIKDTIAGDDFYKKGKTLILACEQGEVEYEEEFLKKYNSEVVYFEDQSEFSVLKLQELVIDKMPSRIVIELNGMWDLKLIQFPEFFKVYQMINFINFQTFPIYFANMRQQFLDVIKQSDVVVFINVNGELDKLAPYSSSFKLTNGNAQFMEMDKEGRLQDAFEIELPYDIDAPVINIKDEDYGIWYIDTFDHRDKYIDKIVEFNCMAVLSKSLPKKTFIAGRLAMTCCSNDIQLYGHLAIDNATFAIKDRMWLHIKAKITSKWSEEYQEDELVLVPESIEKIKEIKDPVLNLANTK